MKKYDSALKEGLDEEQSRICAQQIKGLST